MARDGPTAKTYPQPDQYSRWKARAADLDMSISAFIQAMVEAGMKVEQGFDPQIEPDTSARELRAERNDMEAEVARLSERVDRLEDRLDDSERATVKRVVEESNEASYEHILTRVRETASERVPAHLEALSGTHIHQNPNNLWEPLEDSVVRE